MRLADRLLTIVATATLTSAVWIVIGTVYLGGDGLDIAGVRPGPTDARGVGSASFAPVVRGAHPAEISAPSAGEIAQLAIPVPSVRSDQLVDTFEDARGGGERLHEALDIIAPRGSPVVAAAPGTIERLFHSEAGGNTVYVRSHDRRTIFYYAHLDGYAPDLVEGEKVARGTPLGTVGSTGNASPDAPHLHFAILRTTPEAGWSDPATALDPYPLLRR